MMGPFWGGWMAWGMVLGIVFIAFVVAAIVYLLLGTRSGSRPRPDALSLLRERYARGEIDRTEFEERARVLGGTDHPPPSGAAS